MEVKTKFYCKISQFISHKGLNPLDFKPQFIEGKWYEGAYETWSSQLFKLNNGWKSYWVIDENGDRVEIERTGMRIIFELDESKLRDIKIKNILNG